MTLNAGEVVFVITRRIFENDLRRHFAGVVDSVEQNYFTARGNTFVFNSGTNDFVKREDVRKRIFPLSDGGIIIIVLPSTVKVEELNYSINPEGYRVLTNGKEFSMNISEFGGKI